MNRSLSSRVVALVLGGALAVAACGGDDGDEATTGSPTAGEATFPVTVTADNGEVTIEEVPERIVSLSPSLTEMLFAIDAGAQVVAVDQYSNYPPEAPVTDLSGFRPSVEAIGGYEPDLVVISGDREGAVEALNALGVPTLVLPSAEDLDDVYAQIDLLGHATGHTDEAGELIEQMGEDLTAIAEQAEAVPDLTYFYEVSDSLHTVTSDTFVGELLGLAGLASIADGVDDAAGGFPQLTNEYILDADPDFIFLADTQGVGMDVATVAARPGWSELEAVQSGRVVVLPDDIASRWGPRIVELLDTVVTAIAGDDAVTTTTAA